MTALKILIVAPAWLGDMVMAHSLIQGLKNSGKSVEISVLAPQSTLQLTELMPEVSGRILMPEGHGKFGLVARWKVAQQLRNMNFDEAYVLPNTWKSALVPFLAQIPKRIGWLGELRYGLLTCIHRNVKTLKLMVERYVALESPPGKFQTGMAFPNPHLCLPESIRLRVSQKFQLPKQRPKPILVLSPGAAFGPTKRWPIEYFSEIARQACDQGKDVWVIGGPAEREIAVQLLQSEPRILNFAGLTDLIEMSVLLSMADQVLTNDSGPMHIAASLSVPTFAIFGSSSAEFTPPLGDHVQVIEALGLPCRPCFQRTCPLKHYACLRDLTPEIVGSILANGGGAS